MKNQLQQMAAALATLQAFAERHPLELPDELFMLSVYGPTVTVRAAYAPNQSGIDKLLTACGDSFGREGWVKKADTYSPGRFNYHLDLEGVHIIIEGAERHVVEKDVFIPVPPSAFPLLIAEASEPEAE